MKSETNRPKGQTVSNYKNFPDTFNDHFLSKAEKKSAKVLDILIQKTQVTTKIQRTTSLKYPITPFLI
jgi:hypothetical protein